MRKIATDWYVETKPRRKRRDDNVVDIRAMYERQYGEAERAPVPTKRKDIPETLTVDEVCETLRCARKKVYRLIHTKKLKATKVGIEYLILVPDLMNFLQGRKQA